jgi:signal transduction histidine kinase
MLVSNSGCGQLTRSWLPGFAQVSGIIVAFIGAGFLMAWYMAVPGLVRLRTGFLGMNPATALAFVFCGISLWRVAGSEKKIKVKRPDLFVLVFGAAIFLLGALETFQNFFGLHIPILQHLFGNQSRIHGALLSIEMAPNSAWAFLFCGLALVLFDLEDRRGFHPAPAFILGAALIAVASLMGYCYRVLSLYRVGSAMPMPLSTTIVLGIWCLGALAGRPDRGLMSVLTSATTGGAMARRLLPLAILIPPILGALRLLGEKAGFYPSEASVSIFAVAGVAVFTGVIWWNARLLYRADFERVRTERRLAVQYRCTRAMAEAEDPDRAIAGILQEVSEAFGWPLGTVWMISPEHKLLRCTQLWHFTALDPKDAFVQATRQGSFEIGIDLPGNVWSTGQPLWVPDLASKKDTPRAEAAADAGFRAAFAFPIRLGSEFFGVMEFFSRAPEPLDESLLEMLNGIASQVGLFIKRYRAEQELRRTTDDLARSNTDLQQFAYVASHDLFEPLRMVISFLQLLRDHARENLDKQSAGFIGFALDGAQRMHALINDLLAYSRVGIKGSAFAPTNSERVLDAALGNLKVAIEETQAIVTHEHLPVVQGDSVLLTQVFQNLIGNAIKFHGPEPPRVEVAAKRRNGEWVFSVRDNGIGIDPKHSERIFEIFQRLHTRQEYGGTGIGLAICKRIVERHGGRIWVKSTPQKGSSFFFTLPAIKTLENGRQN